MPRTTNSEIIRLISEATRFTKEHHEALRASIDDRFNAIDSRLQEMSELLEGNGDSEKGLVVRVDRLVETENRRTWMFRTTLAACIAALIGGIAKLFR